MKELHAPLAELLRPKTLSEYVGQIHLTAQGAILHDMIQFRRVHSLIFWGPPGVGKTTLAHLLADGLGMQFFMLSAVSSGVKDVRQVIEQAGKFPGKSLLFIDEIHRFSKSQQDSLLGAVEKGVITLIGATTENPSFEVISPLLSRCQVYILKPLEEKELLHLIDRAVLFYQSVGLNLIVKEKEALLRISGGDARKLYNAIQLLVDSSGATELEVTNDGVQKVIQQNLSLYDKQGEIHYDVISAFIKSVRGSDPNAAVYYLARMIGGGEEPKFIARRLMILAAEDIGLANPNALLLANACFDAVNKIGWPESRIILSETAIYLATSPKSNSAYMAINRAQEEVKRSGDQPVPLHLRNAPTKLMKQEGYGNAYKYAHDYAGAFVPQDFMPERIRGRKLYEPKDNHQERSILERLKQWWKGYYSY
jgi:putative ATPase